MSTFSRALPPLRLATIRPGDTIQDVAAREMGDPSKWVDLAWVNELRPPYVTDDERRAGAGVLLSGSFIKIPAPVGVWRRSDPYGQVFERDVHIQDRRLYESDSGDFAVVAGSANLSQQLQHRIVTPTGQLSRHPGYGCKVYRLLGSVNGPTANILAAGYVKASILSEYRVKTLQSLKAVVNGDKISVTGRVTTIAGGPVDVVVGY